MKIFVVETLRTFLLVWSEGKVMRVIHEEDDKLVNHLNDEGVQRAKEKMSSFIS